MSAHSETRTSSVADVGEIDIVTPAVPMKTLCPEGGMVVTASKEQT
jgi:hypothetical protein